MATHAGIIGTIHMKPRPCCGSIGPPKEEILTKQVAEVGKDKHGWSKSRLVATSVRVTNACTTCRPAKLYR